MDEFNPYASPAALSTDAADLSPSGYRLYLALNLLYAVLIIACLLILLLGGRVGLAVHDLLVIGIFLAPLISCGLVMADYPQVFRYWRFVQALIAGMLLLFCLEDMQRGALVGVGLFMTLTNALSLLASSHFYLLKQAASRPTGAVQKG